MISRQYQITIDDIVIDVEHKDVKNMNLAVYPRNGRVRISAPLRMSGESVRSFAVTRIAWIRKKKQRCAQTNHFSSARFVSGENHHYFGHPCLLNVIEGGKRGRVILREPSTIDMHVRATTSINFRRSLMNEWYRQQLKLRIPDMTGKWAPTVGVSLNEWRVKRMKTRWGSCNIKARRIWLNLELARKPLQCLEYVVVHELVHLLEHRHNRQFYAYMDQFLPDWRMRQGMLELPL